MTDLQDSIRVLSAHYKALEMIRVVPGVLGVHIVSSIGVPFDHFNVIHTKTPNMREYYSLSEIKNHVEDYCQTNCLSDDDECLTCALREFILYMAEREAEAEEEATE